MSFLATAVWGQVPALACVLFDEDPAMEQGKAEIEIHERCADEERCQSERCGEYRKGRKREGDYE